MSKTSKKGAGRRRLKIVGRNEAGAPVMWEGSCKTCTRPHRWQKPTGKYCSVGCQQRAKRERIAKSSRN